jgi:hypothetical protein
MEFRNDPRPQLGARSGARFPPRVVAYIPPKFRGNKGFRALQEHVPPILPEENSLLWTSSFLRHLDVAPRLVGQLTAEGTALHPREISPHSAANCGKIPGPNLC